MGFEVKRTTARLIFDDPEMAGAEVVCRGVPLGTYFELAKLQDVGTDGGLQLMQTFAEKVLDEWNLQEEGVAIPATFDGLMSLEPGMAMAIIDAWIRSVVTVKAPLAEPSTDGDLSAAASIPMVPLSGNHRS